MQQRPMRQPGTPVISAGDSRTARDAVRDVMIVDDHPLMCEALSLTLQGAFGLSRVRQASSLAAAEAQIRDQGPPDAVALDLNLPDVEGIEGILSLRARAPRVLVTVISAERDPEMVSAVLAAGARGFVPKCMPRQAMLEAFRMMWGGQIFTPEGYVAPRGDAGEAADLAESFASLTPQQMNILRLICQGRPNKIISYELSIAEATVKTHIAAIMSKIRVSNRTQAALLANKARLFSR